MTETIETNEDIALIKQTAGDLDWGMFQNGQMMRGNIGGVVSRACDRLQSRLTTLQAAADKMAMALPCPTRLSQLAVYLDIQDKKAGNSGREVQDWLLQCASMSSHALKEYRKIKDDK